MRCEPNHGLGSVLFHILFKWTVALSRLDVAILGRIYFVFCTSAVLLCRFLRIFSFAEVIDIALFTKVILKISICAFVYMSGLG